LPKRFFVSFETNKMQYLAVLIFNYRMERWAMKVDNRVIHQFMVNKMLTRKL
jgi:hypothetical protein